MDGWAGGAAAAPAGKVSEAALSRSRADATLAYKRASFLLPTMRLLSSTLHGRNLSTEQVLLESIHVA